eukprot:CAMPEP_0202454936 /NCGR_PEP_ID=MMETSP1360-20130828/12576_1 /ASSEMBLY_ACC=CAM_ASM_000848 /TAXON_ID=515479 /ORGANISM="Licmophora paradoxa, Strain CCMP2313" /LENGTH=369 /DNA_ID=CAMNT_0049074389 /DNA_START=159 /DNA_END=1268 /DNA_ORIENTATION=+
MASPTLQQIETEIIEDNVESSSTQMDISAVPIITTSTTTTQNETLVGTTDDEYNRGLLVIGGITLLFASNSPVLHAAFSSSGGSAPPVLFLNAAVSCVALVGLLFGGSTLESATTLPSTLKEEDDKKLQAGFEMGLWKTCGTTANLYGLSLTSADHGAFLIQMTTLIVPIVQGLMGVPIPRRIQFAVVMALAGVFAFTQDASGDAATNASPLGDALCVVAAGFYATYDLRLFEWGKRLSARKLITSKIATQAILSLGLLGVLGYSDTVEYLASDPNWALLVPVVLWSGVAVNALAPFLQVGGQQAVGPTRCQTIYASQPLWASMMAFAFLGETVGVQGILGGSAFLGALFLAATADPPEANCGQDSCEV